ncbi:MAG: PEP-CTERM sorting domain-containing protein [Planctomycetota bacterium]|nr:PEP-CTERM sorting domain-containing protein [Planctomycetota bacterium]
MLSRRYAQAVCVAVVLALSFLPTTALADALIDGEGDDSGWGIALDGTTAIGFTLIDVDLSAGEVILSLEKDFGPPEDDDGELEFPVAHVMFNQRLDDANTVGRIIIRSESIANSSGYDWTNFRWSIFQTGVAQFSISGSAGWNVSPFTTKTWQDIDSGDPDLAGELLADGGKVLAGTTYTPSGDLVIITDLTGAAASFSLKQTVVPEPASAIVLLLGAIAMCRRRKG